MLQTPKTAQMQVAPVRIAFTIILAFLFTQVRRARRDLAQLSGILDMFTSSSVNVSRP